MTDTPATDYSRALLIHAAAIMVANGLPDTDANIVYFIRQADLVPPDPVAVALARGVIEVTTPPPRRWYQIWRKR